MSLTDILFSEEFLFEGEQAEKYLGKKAVEKYRQDNEDKKRYERRSKREVDDEHYRVNYGYGSQVNEKDPDKEHRRTVRSNDEARYRAVNYTMNQHKDMMANKSAEEQHNAKDALNRKYRKDAKKGIYHYESVELI